jgi:hypothetical protein
MDATAVIIKDLAKEARELALVCGGVGVLYINGEITSMPAKLDDAEKRAEQLLHSIRTAKQIL